MLGDPGAFLPIARSLGATTERMFIQWATVAPSPSATKPRTSTRLTRTPTRRGTGRSTTRRSRPPSRRGSRSIFEVTGGSPRWASGKNAPTGQSCSARTAAYCAWMPNATMYGQFVHAVTERYDGHFKPTGRLDGAAGRPLLVVLERAELRPGPRPAGDQRLDRAVRAAGLSGAAGRRLEGAAADPTGRPQHDAGRRAGRDGLSAARRRSPRRAAGQRRDLPVAGLHARRLLPEPELPEADRLDREALRLPDDRRRPPASSASQNPGLFNATGFAIHAYDSKQAPDQSPSSINPSYATFPVLKRVEAALDKATTPTDRASTTRSTTTSTAYITSPPAPKGKGDPSAATAAVELNQAEYISYKNPRIAAYGQYLINDPVPNARRSAAASPAACTRPRASRRRRWPRTGCRCGCRRRPSRPAQSAEIWGGARPAALSRRRRAARTVSIQMQKGGNGNWTTIQTVKVAERTGVLRHPHEAALQRQPAAGLHLPADRDVAAPQRGGLDDRRSDRQGHRQRLTSAGCGRDSISPAPDAGARAVRPAQTRTCRHS